MSYPLTPIGPEGPEPYKRLETITLEKAKFAIAKQIGRQVSDAMHLEVREDFISRDLVAVLETYVLSHKDGTDSQEVWSEVEVEVPWNRKWVPSLAAVLVGLGVSSLALTLPWFGAFFVGLATIVLVIYLSTAPQSVKVSKPFIVRAEKWTRFPKNDIVFPKNLGAPVVQIVVDAEERT